MNTTSTTLNVRGYTIRSRSNRRYIVVAVRPYPVITDQGTYVAFVRIERRSDSLNTARKAQRSYGWQNGAFAVVVDSVTGEEI